MPNRQPLLKTLQLEKRTKAGQKDLSTKNQKRNMCCITTEHPDSGDKMQLVDY